MRHPSTAADAAGLKPPQNMTGMTARTNTTEVCLSCGGSNITSSDSSSSAKMNGTITEFKWNNTIP